jgi:hypothetical protein
LFCGDCLVGIIESYPTEFDGRVLKATPISLLAADPQFLALLTGNSKGHLILNLVATESRSRENFSSLQDDPTGSSPGAKPPSDILPALRNARKALSYLEAQAAIYTAATIPVHLQIELEEKRKQVAELTNRLKAERGGHQ